MAEQILPPSPPITGTDGVYVPGAMVYYYRSGTDVLLNIFSNPAGTVALSNPVIADSDGRIPQVFLDGSEVVRIAVHDADNVELYEVDNAPYASDSGLTAADVAHSPTALNSGVTVQEAIANSDARAQTKAPTASPTFTGTIQAAAAILTGAFTSLRVRITGTSDVTLSSTDHPFQIGNTGGPNLAMDINEIQARENGGAVRLNVNVEGGNVALGNASSTVLVDGKVDSAGYEYAAAGQVGDFVLAEASGGAYGYGDITDGGNLLPVSAAGNAPTLGSSFDGFWVCLGQAAGIGGTAEERTTLWRRVS